MPTRSKVVTPSDEERQALFDFFDTDTAVGILRDMASATTDAERANYAASLKSLMLAKSLPDRRGWSLDDLLRAVGIGARAFKDITD